MLAERAKEVRAVLASSGSTAAKNIWRHTNPAAAPTVPWPGQRSDSSRSSHGVSPNSVKKPSATLRPRKPEKIPQSLGPRRRASRIASAEVVSIAVTCENRSAALSAAHERDQDGNQLPGRMVFWHCDAGGSAGRDGSVRSARAKRSCTRLACVGCWVGEIFVASFELGAGEDEAELVGGAVVDDASEFFEERRA